jgi:DNA helicase-2/ATP-dependent DNA helicase PcrA
MASELLAALNPEQSAAVLAPDGPVLVLAGPGSGKTRVLTHRAAYLVRDREVAPWRVMAVTFTNKAAREMKERLRELIGEEEAKALSIGTFHSICARLLRRDAARVPLGFQPNFVIYDSADQLRVVKRAFDDLRLDDKQHDPRAVHGAISRAKNELVGPESYSAGSYGEEIVQRVYQRYHVLLRQANALDFDDLLLEMAMLLDTNPDIRGYYQERYRHVLVDEFQDTNTAQYVILKHIVDANDRTAARNLFVVGDEDQSIYSWRGADFRNVLRFRNDFPDATVVLLERNFRSTQNILDAARGVIDRNKERTPKALWTDAGAGGKLALFEAYNEAEEAAYIATQVQHLTARGEALGGIAVMYRTNAQSRALEDVLVRYRIPYTLVGATRFYDRREVKDVLAYLRLVYNPADDVSFERIVNVPPRGIGPTAVARVRQYADDQHLSLAVALGRYLATDLPDTRTRRVLGPFNELLRHLWAAKEAFTVPDLLAIILKESGYTAWLRDGTDEGEERWENVSELRGLAEDFGGYEPEEGLATMLESVALVSDVDDLDGQRERLTMLTLHSAKGLEFDTVFISGLEEGLVPHSRSIDDAAMIEEERRLLYVGLTRARRRLVLLRVFRRYLYGSTDAREASRFLADIPAHVLDVAGVSAAQRSRPSRPERTVWTTTTAMPAAREPAKGGMMGFRAGDKVRHGTFGEGIVVSSQVRDDDEEVTVAFAKMGIKKLLQSFANLQRA